MQANGSASALWWLLSTRSSAVLLIGRFPTWAGPQLRFGIKVPVKRRDVSMKLGGFVTLVNLIN